MPKDIFQWDRALVHHCPHCFTPLTNPQTQSRCLGEHVEWCKNYHTQLFKKGTSNQCEPCRRTDEEHLKRHREIAEMIHELKKVKEPASPLTPRTNDAIPSPGLSKKERKIAKKAQKISDRAKVVSSADIEFVANIIRPNNPDSDDIDIERQLAEDEDIRLNKFFHKGTGNTREVRNMFIQKKSRGGGKEETEVDPLQLDGLLQLLNVSPITSKSSAQEKIIVTNLRKKIEEDLIAEQHEQEQMKQRKTGFWRWASRKALKRLIQNGKNWGDKGTGGSAGKGDGADSSSSSSAFGGAEADIDSTEPDSDVATRSDYSSATPLEEDEVASSSEDNIVESMAAVKLDSESAEVGTPRKLKLMNDGWTTVGKQPKPKTPAGKFTLVGNNGLAKIAKNPSPSSHGFYSSMLGRDYDA